VLQRDPEYERALPVALWRRWRVDHHPDHTGALLDYLDRHPGRRFGRRLVAEMADPYPWGCYIPEPADATVNLLRRWVEEQHQPDEPFTPGALQIEQLQLSHIESPSALLTLALLTGTSLGERVEVDAVQQPDPRMARRPSSRPSTGCDSGPRHRVAALCAQTPLNRYFAGPSAPVCRQAA